MQLYYSEDAKAGSFILPEEEARHCVKVMRFSSGDLIKITDGLGNIYSCQLMGTDTKNCLVEAVDKPEFKERTSRPLHIAIAPTKNASRLEWFVEKATEIGIDKITPLICERSERRKVNTSRLQRVAIAAMKQSMSAWLPEINQEMKYGDLIRQPIKGQKFIAALIPNAIPLVRHLIDNTENLVLIGPEGDFSNKEIGQAIKSDFIPVSLGSSRLRTETAGIVACSIVNLAKGK